MTASASTSAVSSASALQRCKSSFIAVSPKDYDAMTDRMDDATSTLSSPSSSPSSTSGDDEPQQHCGRQSASSVEQQGSKGRRGGIAKRRYYLQLPTPPPSPFSAYSNGEPFPPAAAGAAPAQPETPSKARGPGGLFTKKIEIAKRGSSRRTGPAAAKAGGGLGNFIMGCFGTGEMIY